MAWLKLDDQFFYHPKVIAAGRDARDLYIAGLSYSAGQLTDGHIQEGAIGLIAAMAQVPDGADCVKRLVEVGLWERSNGGYEIHDYLKYNPSGDDVRRIRAERSDAGKRGARVTNEQRWGTEPASEPAQESANVSSSDDNICHQIIAPSPSPSPSPCPYPSPTPKTPNTNGAYIAAGVRAIENGIGLITTQTQREEIPRMLDELHSLGYDSWLQSAIDIAVDKGGDKRSWDYVRGILENHIKDGTPPARRGMATRGNGNGKLQGIGANMERMG